MKLRYEPVMVRMVIAALVAMAVNLLDLGEIDTDTTEAVVSFGVIVVGALMARGKVTPTAKLEAAGISQDDVDEKAADPDYGPMDKGV